MNIFAIYAPKPVTEPELTAEEIAQDNADWQRWMNTETISDRHPERYDAE